MVWVKASEPACETKSQGQMRQLTLIIWFVGRRKRRCIPAKGRSMLKRERCVLMVRCWLWGKARLWELGGGATDEAVTENALTGS
jgi:hypothetical protein